MYTLYVHPRSRQVPMNLETDFDRYGHLAPCQNGWLLRPLRSRKGISQLGIPKMRQNLNSLGLGHLRPLWALTSPGRGDNDVPPFNGPTGGTLRAHPGLARDQTHLG